MPSANPSPSPDAAAVRPSRGRLPGLVLAALAAGIAGLVWVSRRQAAGVPEPLTREFAVFDSYARITLWASPQVAEEALQECAARLAELHRALNRFDPASEVSALNAGAAAQPFVCSPLLWDVLQAARRAHRQTGGAFDVSVGPVMAVWGFHRKRDTLPSDAEIRDALARVGLQHVEFDDLRRSARFTVEGMSLDFGGLAKGYALDMVTGILARRGIDRFLVDLGGNVACAPIPPPGRDCFFIGVRNPFERNALLGRLPVLGKAVSTSGNYERRILIQGREIGHIIEPRTGRPVTGPAGVTAVTPRGTDSDVFSTAVYVAGRPLAKELCRTVPGTGFVLVYGTPQAPVVETVGAVTLLDAPPAVLHAAGGSAEPAPGPAVKP